MVGAQHCRFHETQQSASARYELGDATGLCRRAGRPQLVLGELSWGSPVAWDPLVIVSVTGMSIAREHEPGTMIEDR